MKERDTIHGYGAIHELDLSDGAIVDYTDEIEGRGDFIESMEAEIALGGVGSKIKQMFGAGDSEPAILYRFKGGYFAVIADGEYIFAAWFGIKEDG